MDNIGAVPADETPMKQATDHAPSAGATVRPEDVDRALDADDVEHAIALVERAGRELFAGRLRIGLDRFEAWLERLRPYVQERPWLLYSQAWLWTTERRNELAAVALQRAARLFEARPESEERREALVLVQLARGVVAERDAKFAEAREAFAAATDLLGASAARESWIDEADEARWRERDASGAASFYLAAIPALRAAGEPVPLARCLNNLAMELLRRGEPAPARRAALQAVELKRGVDIDSSLGNSLNTLGMAEQQLGMYERARVTLSEAIALAERGGHKIIHAYALTNLAEVERDAGEIAAASALYERSLVEKQQLKDDYGLAYLLRSWSVARRRAGEVAEALGLIERAVRMREPLNDPYETAQLRVEQGLVRLARGDTDAARRSLEEAAFIAGEIDAKAISHVARVGLRALERDDAGVEEILASATRFHLEAFLRAEAVAIRDRTPRARVWILGGFRIEIGGRAVESSGWRSKRAAELLRVLVSRRNGGIARDELAETLWPGGPDATGNLNAAVNAARRGLEQVAGRGAWILREGDRYRLGNLEWVDADALVERYEAARRALAARERRAAREHLRVARDLARGEAYPDDRYAEWAAPERARLAEIAQLVRETLAAVALELGQPDEAVLAALDAIGAEPSRESAYRLLIRAHLARGDRASARRALAGCRQALKRELDIEPSRETVALVGES